ncbi:MAG: GDP-L-fucose synthase [Rhizobiaceae bacterium]
MSDEPASPATGRTPYDLAGKRVFVAGHRGMVGSALCGRLASENCEVLTATRIELDLRRQDAVEAWMAKNRPDVVVIAAATVGGIHANDAFPADFLYDNVMIEANLVHASYRAGVEKALFLGSSCIYPREAEQPMREDALLTGPLETTNQWYAVAKIAGIKLTQAYRRQHGCDFISAMPTNLYGPRDNFDLQTSHVLPALMRKIDSARSEDSESVTIWGSGRPQREFMYVRDLADALVFLLKHYSAEEHINIGVGSDISIADLAAQIAQVVGWEGRFDYDASKPDGTPRKLMDSSRLAALGWRPRTSLEDGIRETYEWFAANREKARM